MDRSQELLSIMESKRRTLSVQAARYVGHPDAEDLVHNAFIRAWQNIDSFEGRNGASLYSWLCGLLRFECFHYLRGKGKRLLSKSEPLEESMLMEDGRLADRSILLREIMDGCSEKEAAQLRSRLESISRGQERMTTAERVRLCRAIRVVRTTFKIAA